MTTLTLTISRAAAALAISAASVCTQPLAAAQSQQWDPVGQKLNELDERAKLLQRQAQRAEREADELEQKSQRDLDEIERLSRENAQQRRDAERQAQDAAEQRGRAEREQKQAEDEARRHEEAASSGRDRDAELASEYEREHQAEIDRRRREMEERERRYREAVEAFGRACDDPNSKDIRKALKKNMLRLKDEYDRARNAHDEINPPGEKGQREKADRQRKAEAQRARDAKNGAADAARAAQQAERARKQAEQNLRDLEAQEQNLDAQRREAQQKQAQAEQLRKEAEQARKDAAKAEQERSDLAQRQAEMQREHEENVAAQEEADQQRRSPRVEKDLDIPGDSLEDVSIDDLLRRLAKKLLESNDPVQNEVGRALGAKAASESMKRALGMRSVLHLAWTLASTYWERWSMDDVIAGGFVIENDTLFGNVVVIYNKKTGQYIVQVKMYFPESKNTPLAPGVERGKSYTITFTGQVTLIGK